MSRSSAAEQGVTGFGPNSTFDPLGQQIDLTMPDGVTTAAVPMDRISILQTVAVQTGIIYGVQFGICAILLMVLFLMTKREKRCSVVFILNVTCLGALVLRSVLIFTEINGVLYNFYNWVNGWYPDSPALDKALGESVTAEVFSFVSIAAIELSMMFQTHIVCCTLSTLWRRLVWATCFVIALQAIAIRFACMVVNCAWVIVHFNEVTMAQHRAVASLASAFNISVVISIILFSIIFCAKLGHAIYHRRKMGMKQFGPMQIIFVMGCQTLILPAIFGIISYWVLPGAQIQSMMPAIVAIFLPLSSLWASTNTTQNINIAAPQQWRIRIQSDGKSDATYDSEKQLLGTNTDTLVGDPRNASFSGAPKNMGHHATASRDSIDLEMAKMGHRIQVDRTWNVRTE